MSPAPALAISQPGEQGGANRAATQPLLTHTSQRVSGNTFAILEDICCCSEHPSFLITPQNNEP